MRRANFQQPRPRRTDAHFRRFGAHNVRFLSETEIITFHAQLAALIRGDNKPIPLEPVGI